MQRAFESANRAGNGRVHVRKSGRSHAGGEGRGIQLMIGMEDQRHIQGFFRRRARLFSVEHQQEVARMRKGAIRLHNVLALAHAVIPGHDHGDL